MKKLFTILLCLSMAYVLTAQENSKQREVGLVFSNFDNFGISYKTGTKRSLWRYNTLIVRGNNNKEDGDFEKITRNNTGFELKFGKEFRRDISDKLEFRFGADLSFRYRDIKYENESKIDNVVTLKNNRTVYEPGLNLVLGFNYVVNDNIIIGAEMLPFVRYSTGTSETRERNYSVNSNTYIDVDSDISGFSYGLSNSSVMLSVAYRF
ncbi:MAG: hypothetical protein N4A72_07475 [Bacteroidales bacterium]|jgi:hypothetical protein|nr:hypothetical protein [Bacteroidales bacterium]